VADDDDLEPLDSAESLWRALRKEAGLTRVGRAIVVAVFLTSGLVAVLAYYYLGFTHSQHRALIALGFAAGAVVVGPLLGLVVAGLDASVRRLFLRESPADTALREAWELGMGDEGYTDAVVDRAAELLPTLLEAGYAKSDDAGWTWSFTDHGVQRAEELGL
jgi:hypothetical protein